MALDLNQLRNRLSTIKQSATQDSAFWKPTSGESIVRIVPYRLNPSWPFNELTFHYQFGKPILSLVTFNEPDPVVEFIRNLRSTQRKDDYEMSKHLEPKMRTYVPVLVRGEEDKGIRWWGFGKQVYEKIMSIMQDSDFGDITNVAAGHDLKVYFKTAKEAGKKFPETSISARPAKTPLTESAEQLKGYIDSQKDIFEIFKKPTYEDIKKALAEWVDNGGKPTSTSGASEEESYSAPASAKKPAPETPTKQNAPQSVLSIDEINATFADLLNKKG